MISFVYFDVGGVVLLDYSETNKWEEMKAGLGVTPELDAAFEHIWDEYHNRICLDYDIEQLVPLLRARLGLKIPATYSMIQDFVNRYDPNPSIWPVIKLIQSKYKSGLLTNMYPKLLAAIYARKELNIAWDWNVIIDSSVVKAQKPDQKIFEIAQDKAGFPPEEILFVENQQRHLDGAKALGWQTFLYDPKNPAESSQALAKLMTISAN